MNSDDKKVFPSLNDMEGPKFMADIMATETQPVKPKRKYVRKAKLSGQTAEASELEKAFVEGTAMVDKTTTELLGTLNAIADAAESEKAFSETYEGYVIKNMKSNRDPSLFALGKLKELSIMSDGSIEGSWVVKRDDLDYVYGQTSDFLPSIPEELKDDVKITDLGPDEKILQRVVIRDAVTREQIPDGTIIDEEIVERIIKGELTFGTEPIVLVHEGGYTIPEKGEVVDIHEPGGLTIPGIEAFSPSDAMMKMMMADPMTMAQKIAWLSGKSISVGLDMGVPEGDQTVIEEIILDAKEEEVVIKKEPLPPNNTRVAAARAAKQGLTLEGYRALFPKAVR